MRGTTTRTTGATTLMRHLRRPVRVHLIVRSWANRMSRLLLRA
jgi:hypothetical protein